MELSSVSLDVGLSVPVKYWSLVNLLSTINTALHQLTGLTERRRGSGSKDGSVPI